MKILVTGGTGVIGAAALPALLKAGHEIRLLSRHAEQDVEQYPGNVVPFAADVTKPHELRGAVEGCACVLHVAGIDEEQPPEVTYERVNVEGTRALCEAAAAAETPPYFIQVSSLGAERGESEYHRSKFRAEQHVRRYPGLWLILRPGGVYGPGDGTVSMLLKMMRSLAAVPVVEAGDQPFQPLWYADFGEAIAQAVSRPDLTGRTLELAGPDVTTTMELLERLARITGRNPARLPMPAWLAEAGATAAESLGGVGGRLVRRAGFALPINRAKLRMLMEGNVIGEGHANALLTEFAVTPTGLTHGLELLADMLPEQIPGHGVGAVERTIYSAEIQGSRYTPAELIDAVCDRIAQIMPIEFAAEPGVPTAATEGGTMTAALPARGHIQIRMAERTDTTATFVTLEGHPLAGVLTLAAEPDTPGVRFLIEMVTQPANVLDWFAMRTFGGFLQSQNWRKVVRNVVDLSGGAAPAGVQKSKERLSEHEVRTFTQRARELIDAQQRKHTQETIARPD